MRVVLINTPWARDRLKNVNDWWGFGFSFDEIIDVQLDEIPFQASPDSTAQAVLDMQLVSQYKKGFTIFVTPYIMAPKDRNGNVLERRASVNGLYMPPLLWFQRIAWWATTLFWNSPAITVHSNENDQLWSNGKALGPAFEMWLCHELSHFLYWVAREILPVDNTHSFFYGGAPEKARAEIQEFFLAKDEEEEPEPEKPAETRDVEVWAKAIQDFEGWVAPGEKDRTGEVYANGSKSYRNNNPGNIKGVGGGFLKFDTYKEGFDYLVDYLTRAATGRHRAYHPEMSLHEFFRTYAPDPEPIPHNYADFVAKRLGVTIYTKIKSLV